MKFEGNYTIKSVDSIETSLKIANGLYAIEYPIAAIIDAVRPRCLPNPFVDPKKLELLFGSAQIPKPVFDVTQKKDPFETDFSLWYLLVDLVDLRKLVSSVFTRNAILRVRSQSTAKQLANNHLMVQFGIIPTVADIQDFVSQLKYWEKKYTDAQEKLNNDFRWHFTKNAGLDIVKLLPEVEDQTYTVRLPLTQQDVTITVTSSVVRARWHASALCHWQCPEFRSWLDRVRAFVDQFGLLDPAAIWDVIPWSFVVDWFYGVGNWLHSYRPRLLPATLNVKDYCESISILYKQVYTVTYQAWSSTDGHPGGISRTTAIAGETTTTYIRRRFKPPAVLKHPPFKGTGLVSLRRIAISASLIAQRLPR